MAEKFIYAYKLRNTPDVPIIPAHSGRHWIPNESFKPFNRARHCLPLMMANQAGWFLLNPYTFIVKWNGENKLTATYMEENPPDELHIATDMFPGPVLTFRYTHLFRTSPGYNLWVRGPSNMPKRGITALEGIVETDWAMTPFTMNWFITEPHRPIIFEKNEPFCMIIPQRRYDVESFDTDYNTIESEPELDQAVQDAFASRKAFMQQPIEVRQRGQLDYFHGRTATGDPAPEHQTAYRLKTFKPTWHARFTNNRKDD